MRKIGLLLSFLLLVSQATQARFAASSETGPDTDPVSPGQTRIQLPKQTQNALQRAAHIFEKALARNPDENLWRDAMQRLATADIRVVPDTKTRTWTQLEHEACDKTTENDPANKATDGKPFFPQGTTLISRQRIYVCPQMKKEEPGEYAQFFVHESFHLTGINDECTTQGHELDVMKAGTGHRAEGGYENCGD